ncbi:MAG: NAD-dependent epimerase/dehydratase family protein [Sideroxydans sp.]|nr:NAD-dependent epimerase/dehydratase family protein [Sideroxydans sp.]
MKRLLIIGCGDIALRTIPMLRGRYRLYALLRNPAQRDKLRALGVTTITGDLDDRRSLQRIAGIADVVLHFAPPAVSQKSSTLSPPPCRGRVREGVETLPLRDSTPIPTLPLQGGRGEFGSKKNMGQGGFAVDLRTRHLLAALLQATPPTQLLYISTSGVYGDCAGDIISETHKLNPQTPRAQLRADAENQIRNWAKRTQVSAHILRVPGIYAADRLPLQRIRSGAPAIVAEQDSYTNHIHADDLARIVVAALRHAQPNRIYHAADGGEMKMGDYFDVVAAAFNLPRPPRLPREEVQRAVSPAMWSFMEESRRMTNERMKRELKVKLRYATVGECLRVLAAQNLA